MAGSCTILTPPNAATALSRKAVASSLSSSLATRTGNADVSVFADVLERSGRVTFTGYDQIDGEAAVKVLVAGPRCGREAGTDLGVVLDRTPFYAEGGGQLSDTGVVRVSAADGSDALVEVRSVQTPLPGVVVHQGVVRAGEVTVDTPAFADSNGVERRFLVPREYERGERLRLLYAGTWLDQRGIFYLRDALRALAQIPGMTLTIAGPGDPAEEILRFLGDELAARVVVRPVVAAEGMPELYSEHDVFVFPSLMEGLPTVLLEAMANGMPVITTETCGMPDVVENECNGLLIPPADAAALEEAILRLAGSAELCRKLGQAACESMRRHTWEGAGQRLEALFLHVLARDTRERAGSL